MNKKQNTTKNLIRGKRDFKQGAKTAEKNALSEEEIKIYVRKALADVIEAGERPKKPEEAAKKPEEAAKKREIFLKEELVNAVIQAIETSDVIEDDSTFKKEIIKKAMADESFKRMVIGELLEELF